MKTLRHILRFFLLPLLRLRAWVVRRLLHLRAKLQVHSLRTAIVDADKDKSATGRKNMVVFNTTSGAFEPVQKRLLKHAARAGKNRSNRSMTTGRRRELAIRRKKRQDKPRYITPERIHHIENKSLYVTS